MPGDVIGHRAGAARRSLHQFQARAGRLVLVGHEPRIVEKRLEQLAHDAPCLGGHAPHLVVLVHMLAQERLERVIEFARVFAEADQRPAMRPAPRRSTAPPTRASRAAEESIRSLTR